MRFSWIVHRFFIIETIQLSFIQITCLTLFSYAEEDNFANKNSDSEPQFGALDLEYGDILFTPEQRSNTPKLPKVWPNGIVPYEFDSGFSWLQRRKVRYAMWLLKDQTDGCIKFIERTSQQNYLKVVKSGGNKSQVGYIGGMQKVWIADYAFDWWSRSVYHELIHTLGFWHMQQRPDRDKYITIIWKNIMDGAYSEFRKRSPVEFGYVGDPYDYSSVMHYNRYVWSKNGGSTMTAKDSEYTDKLGGERYPTALDIKKLKRRYKCD